MFGRDKKAAEPNPQDQAFPFMTATEANDFRRLVAQAFAAAGNPVYVQPDHVVDSNGQQFGLWNLAAYCKSSEEGRAGWEQAIADHVHNLMNPPPAVASLADTELLAIVHARLYPADSLGEAANWVVSSDRAVPEGLVECLVADFPSTVAMLSADDVVARNIGALWTRARANTRAVPVGEKETVDLPDGGKVIIAFSESFLFASRVVDMPPLLEEVYGPRQYPLGVVVGVPHRHEVVLHALEDSRSITAIGAAAKFTAHSFAESPGSISPLLYWWNGQGFQTVSRVEPDGGVGIIADGPFLDAVNALAAR